MHPPTESPRPDLDLKRTKASTLRRVGGGGQAQGSKRLWRKKPVTESTEFASAPVRFLRRSWKRHGREVLAGAAAGTAGIAAGKAITDRRKDRNWNRAKERVKSGLVTGVAGATLGGLIDSGKSGFRGARAGALLGGLAGLLRDPKKPRSATADKIAGGGDWDFEKVEIRSGEFTFELLPPEKRRDALSTARDAGLAAAGVGTAVAATKVGRQAQQTLREAVPWAKRTWDRDVKQPAGAVLRRWRRTAKDVSSVAAGIGRDVRAASENVGSLKSVGDLGERAKKFLEGDSAQPQKSVLRRALRWGATRMLEAGQGAGPTLRFAKKDERPNAAGAAATGAVAGGLAGAAHLPGRDMKPGENLSGKRVARRTPWPLVQHEGIGAGRGQVMEVKHQGLRDPDAHVRLVSDVKRWAKGRRFKVLDDQPSNPAAARARGMKGRTWNYCLWGNNCQHATEHARNGSRPAVSRQWRQAGKGAVAGAAVAAAADLGLSAWRQRLHGDRDKTRSTAFARGEYLDDQGRHVSAWDVLKGSKLAYNTKYDPGSGRHRVDISSPKEAGLIDAAGAVHGKAKAVARWGDRGVKLVRDAGDALSGRPRRRDASGRPQKREWEKSWVQRHAKELLATGALVASGVAYRKLPRFRRTVDATRETVTNHVNAVRRKVGFSAGRNEDLTRFARRDRVDRNRREVKHSPGLPVAPVAVAGGAAGATVAAGAGMAHAVRRSPEYGKMQKLWRVTTGRGSVWPEREAALRKNLRAAGRAIRPRLGRLGLLTAAGASAGAAAAGGVAHGLNRGGEKRMEAMMERLCELMVAKATVTRFDEAAAEAGWDVRDPRGRSARVFSPGSRPRERREKKWHERVENERKLWVAGTGAAALGGAALAGLVLKKKPALLGLRGPAPGVTKPRAAGPKRPRATGKRPVVVPFPKAG
jgi:hypothetical protein